MGFPKPIPKSLKVKLEPNRAMSFIASVQGQCSGRLQLQVNKESRRDLPTDDGGPYCSRRGINGAFHMSVALPTTTLCATCTTIAINDNNNSTVGSHRTTRNLLASYF